MKIKNQNCSAKSSKSVFIPSYLFSYPILVRFSKGGDFNILEYSNGNDLEPIFLK